MGNSQSNCQEIRIENEVPQDNSSLFPVDLHIFKSFIEIDIIT